MLQLGQFGLARVRITGFAIVVSTLLLGICTLPTITTQNVAAQETDSTNLCESFPSNSRCQGESAPVETDKQDDDSANAWEPEVIKFRLDSSSGANEWIRVEVSDDGAGSHRIRALHTVNSPNNVSRNVNGLAGFFSPVPLPTFYNWQDSQTTRLTFQPDKCESQWRPVTSESTVVTSNCIVEGKDFILLPKNTKLTQGRFTMEYTQGDASIMRTVSFRVPLEEANEASSENSTQQEQED
jgi:hypothetical protein